MSIENISPQIALQSIQTNHDIDTNDQNVDQSEIALEEYSKYQLEQAVKGINDFMESSNTHIQFKLHEKLNEYYVTIVDDITKEIVREIPSKKILDVYAAMTEFIGLIVDKKI
ncbi:flagellar protein FlaG [Metabacillus halosaccharovorans]|uniref:flagellar protein FlaG n=1 Tax=Metabacillus halosaccharovorans TaxID=930124 RepID=UPI00203E96D7|nr:flagellar protein FlaG [Metabacillus halosaccharovorans]MCM3443059.1 flagellar protein FlaG [Metabacillus halosaccharovorans]